MSLAQLRHWLKHEQLNTGADGAGVDWIWYGSTSGAEVTADASADEWLFDGIDIGLQDSDELRFGDADDVVMRWDGTDFDILPAADDSVLKFGNGTLNFDIWMYGASASDNIILDASANTLKLDGIDMTLEDSDILAFGDADDVTMTWNGSVFLLTGLPASDPAVANALYANTNVLTLSTG